MYSPQITCIIISQIPLCFWDVAPHDILHPEPTMPCHKKVKLYYILRDLLTHCNYIISWGFFRDVGCTT